MATDYQGDGRGKAQAHPEVDRHRGPGRHGREGVGHLRTGQGGQVAEATEQGKQDAGGTKESHDPSQPL